MNNVEILKKVKRNPNELDEMEIQILEKSMRISTIVIPLLSIFFIIIRFLNPYITIINIADLLSIVFAELFVSKTYEYKKLHKKIDLILSILSFIITISLIIFYIFSLR